MKREAIFNVRTVLVVLLVGVLAAPALASGADPNLIWKGGPVLTAPKAYMTYWHWDTPVADPVGAEPYLDGFFQGIGGSGWANIQTQYSGSNGPITNPTNQFGGAWHDDAATSIPLADVAGFEIFLQQEVQKSVTHFGYDANGVYFVALPHGLDLDFAGGYCAYHSTMKDSHNRSVAYAILPYVSDFPTLAPGAVNALASQTPVAGCGTDFIANSPHGALDSFSMTAGHEYAEAVTDPIPATGWIDANGAENGDKCQFVFDGPGAYQEITLSTGTYGVQGLWSNADNGCVAAY